jgi:hypothetical protein
VRKKIAVYLKVVQLGDLVILLPLECQLLSELLGGDRREYDVSGMLGAVEVDVLGEAEVVLGRFEDVEVLFGDLDDESEAGHGGTTMKEGVRDRAFVIQRLGEAYRVPR